MPFFSIVVPVYNCEKYIRQCIQSVIDQTYSSWELVLVDDGSTDASGNICDNFCGDSRVKVIHQENVGELYSRQNGIAIANGEYVLGLDADDYLDSNCLEVLKKNIDDTGSDLILYSYRMVGGYEGDVRGSLKAGREYSRKEILEVVIRETNHSLCNKAIKLDKVKAALNTRIDGPRFSADYTLIIPILCNIDTGFMIEDVLYNYRIYDKSMSHSYKIQHIFDIGDVTNFVICKLEKALLIDDHMSELIYLSYLKMISFRIVEVFANRSITRADCRKIHESDVYINSKKVESLKNFRVSTFWGLKLFRYRMYGILNLLIKIWKFVYCKGC